MKKISTFLFFLVITLSINAQNIMFSEAFNSGEGEFEINNVKTPEGGSYVWKADIHDNLGYMKATAYIGGKAVESEGWLISPLIDLSSATTAKLSFEHAAKYELGVFADEMTLWAGTSMGDQFDPSNWTQISIPTYPTSGDWIWTPSGEIDLADYVGADKGKIRFAFRYKSTNEAADAWQVRNFKIEGDGTAQDVFNPETAVYEEAKVTYWGKAYSNDNQSFTAEISTAMQRDEYATPTSEGATLYFSIYTSNSNSYCGEYAFSYNSEELNTFDATYSYFQQFDKEGYGSTVSMFSEGSLKISYAGNKEFKYVFDVTDYLGHHIAGEMTKQTPAFDTEGNSINDQIIEENSTSTDVENTSANDFIVYSNNGNLFIQTEEGNNIEIYNINGKIVYQQIANSSLTIVDNLANSGLMIVKINNSVVKISL